MSQPASSSSFKSIFNAALEDYARRSGTKLDEHHPLIQQLETCNSVDSISSAIQQYAQWLRESRGEDGKMMRSLKGAVQVLYTLSTSTILGEGIGITLPPSKAVFAAFGVLLGAVKDVGASYDALIDLFESIKRFLCRLEIYTNIPLTTAMTVVVIEKLAEVLSVLALATKQVKWGRIKRFVMKILGENDIEALLKRLDRLTQEEGVAAGAQILEDVHDLVQYTRAGIDERGHRELPGRVRGGPNHMQNVSSDIKKAMRVELQQNMQRWLSPPDPWKNHNIARESQHSGTATWWIYGETFSKWKCSGPSSLLWLHGKPGAGKSVLCSSIIQDIQSMCVSGHALLAFFYCDFREDQKKDGRGLLSSLLVQLCGQSDAYYDDLSKFYLAHDNGSRHASDSELTQCLKHVLELPEQATVYVIIDALDECPTAGLPSPREQVLEFVKELVEAHIPNLRICVTSRSEDDIERLLHPLAHHSVSLHGENGQVQDIAEYVKFVVDTDPRMQKWREEDKQHVVEVLTSKADGMFRWVYCQLQYLRQCLRQRIQRALDELPDTLDETYDRTLEEIGKQNWEYAHRLFQCVAVASRPLRVKELAEFLVFDFDTDSTPTPREDWREEDPAQAVRSTCFSLLSIIDVDGSSVIQFSHFSVKEYLTSERLAQAKDTISKFHVSMTSAHTFIAQACLGVLLHIDDGITEDGLESLPLVKYVAEHWVGHAQFEDVSSFVIDGLKRLFDPNIHHLAVWLWIYDPASPRRRHNRSKYPPQGGVPALHYATICGLNSIVEFMIVERSWDVNALGFDRNETPLAVASRFGHAEAARILLEHGADTKMRDKYGWSPLQRASENGHVDVVRVLLEHGAKVMALDSTGTTPLHTSSAYGQPGSARVLLEHGADVHAKGMDGVTPLHWASNEQVARILLDHGADPNAKDDFSRTPLREARVKRRPEVERLLLERGAEENNTDAMANTTPLHTASAAGQLAVVTKLLEAGADVNAKGNDDNTPLHYASNEQVVRILLDHGADPNARNSYNRTPLHEAVKSGSPEIAHALLDQGAEPDSPDIERRTPLHLASEAGYTEGVRLLLRRNSDVHARDCWGLTPFEVASANRRHDTMDLLLQHGAEDHRSY